MAMLRFAFLVAMLSPCGLFDPADVQTRDRSAHGNDEDGLREPRGPASASDPIDTDGDGTPD
jgi:hypothetical protein